ncbi:hypothetical protein AgCh_025643 [Apium graveolens]
MGLPAVLWGEAVCHSVYILNRLPTRALSNQTPYEVWIESKPNLSQVRVFGCLTHMKILDVHTKKLDDKSMKVINLGREPSSKAYRVYDPVKRRIHVSRDVVFEESKVFEPTGSDNGDDQQSHDSDTWERDFQTPSRSAVSGTSESESINSSQSSTNNVSSHRYDDSGEPLHFRSLRDVYDSKEHIELEHELLFAGTKEPQNYEQVVGDKNWRLAMKGEMASIEKNGTWKLTKLPDRKKVIDLKWVYKIKKNTYGEVVKYKARLVAKGYV